MEPLRGGRRSFSSSQAEGILRVELRGRRSSSSSSSSSQSQAVKLRRFDKLGRIRRKLGGKGDVGRSMFSTFTSLSSVHISDDVDADVDMDVDEAGRRQA